ncbi:hypothetical protein Tco_1300780 [Tanacetum coccineum]
MEHARKQKAPKETITSSDTTTLAEFDQKTTLFETMTKSKAFNKSLKQRALYHALMELILEDEDAMDEGFADKLKKRKPDDADKYEGPSARSDRGLKRQKTSKDTEQSKKAKVSKHDVYSMKRILVVTNVKVKEWYGYGHLEETKNRLFNLKGNVIVHLAVALRMFTRRIMIKFSDGTLVSLCDTLKDMANNLEIGYISVMPRREWSSLDKKRSRIMIKDIDRQLLDKRLMRSLEKFVGGRYYGEDLRLL